MERACETTDGEFDEFEHQKLHGYIWGAEEDLARCEMN